MIWLASRLNHTEIGCRSIFMLNRYGAEALVSAGVFDLQKQSQRVFKAGTEKKLIIRRDNGRLRAIPGLKEKITVVIFEKPLEKEIENFLKDASPA